MKKLFCILLALTIFFGVVTFSACDNLPNTDDDKASNKGDTIQSNSVKGYSQISLTLDNYTNYILIDVYGVNFSCKVASISSIYGNTYEVCCTCVISTKRKTDCYFQNVSISYELAFNYWKAYGTADYKANLGYDGNSVVTSFLHDGDYIRYGFPSLDISNCTVTAISGYVLVPQN